jgi:hypothetical protein
MNNFEMSDEQRKELKPIWAAIEVFGRHFDGLAKQVAEDEVASVFTQNFVLDEIASHNAVLIVETAVRELGEARLAFGKAQLDKLKTTMNALYALETKALESE